MKIVIEQSILYAALVKLKTVVDAKSFQVAMQKVRITTENGDRIILAGSDIYQQRLEITLGAEVITPGDCLLDYAKLTKVVKTLKGPLSLMDTAAGEDEMILSSNARRQVKLSTSPAGDYPAAPEIGKKHCVLTFIDMVSRVAYAQPFNEIEISINGVLFERKHDTLLVCATDRYRLARVTRKDKGESFSYVLHQDSAKSLPKLFDVVGGTIEMYYDDKSPMFSGQTMLIKKTKTRSTTLAKIRYWARVSDIQFPPYEQVIPKAFTHVLRLDRSAWLNQVDWLCKVEPGCSGQICRFEDVIFKMIGDESECQCTCDLIEGGTTPGAFNVHIDYIREALVKQFKGLAEVDLALNGPLDPVVIRCCEDGDDESCAVIMTRRSG